jgi:hypothetical protein
MDHWRKEEGMKNPIPKPWSLLMTEDDSDVIVLPPDFTDKALALLALIEETTGDRFSATNPVIKKAIDECQINTWYYCTKAFMEADTDLLSVDWYGPNGDGKRHIRVLWYPRSVWVLADEATEAQI